jgi:hypothetical protein
MNIKYEGGKYTVKTPCPFIQYMTVASYDCQRCAYFISDDSEKNILNCNYKASTQAEGGGK